MFYDRLFDIKAKVLQKGKQKTDNISICENRYYKLQLRDNEINMEYYIDKYSSNNSQLTSS